MCQTAEQLPVLGVAIRVLTAQSSTVKWVPQAWLMSLHKHCCPSVTSCQHQTGRSLLPAQCYGRGIGVKWAVQPYSESSYSKAAGVKRHWPKRFPQRNCSPECSEEEGAHTHSHTHTQSSGAWACLAAYTVPANMWE